MDRINEEINILLMTARLKNEKNNIKTKDPSSHLSIDKNDKKRI